MKVLVYGAGVLGGLFAHFLCEANGVEPTLLARGSWADAIERDGLCVHHFVGGKTTVDRIPVVRALEPADSYDLVFVVMQAPQVPAVLPVLAESGCRRVVFVGNNVDAKGTVVELARLAEAAGSVPKEAAFGFQLSAGHRESGQISACYLRRTMTLGAADGALSEEFETLLDQLGTALGGVGYSFVREDRMDAWLKWHAAYVTPLAYLAYACGCDLTRATRTQRMQVLDATREIAGLFRAHGILVLPEGDDLYFEPGPKRVFLAAAFFVTYKTPIGRLCITDHCLHAVNEMRFLTDSLEALFPEDEMRAAAPTYFALKARMPSWDELLVDPRCVL